MRESNLRILFWLAMLLTIVGCRKPSASSSPTDATENRTEARADQSQGEGTHEETQVEPTSSEPAEAGSNAVASDSNDNTGESQIQDATDDAASAIDPVAKPVSYAKQPVLEISFDDLNLGMPEDSRFRPIMLTYNGGRAKELLGKRIRVGGYMNATESLRGVTEFILLKNLDCKFGPGGQADHLIHVLMQGDAKTDYTDKVVYVEGLLELKPFPEDGASTWSIYDLKATRVSTRRR